MTKNKQKDITEKYTNENKNSRIRFWCAALLSFLSAYLLKASSGLNTSGTIMYYALMQVAIAFIKRRVKFKSFKVKFASSISFEEQIKTLIHLGGNGPTGKQVLASFLSSSKIVLMILTISVCDMPTWLLSTLSIDFLNYFIICTLQPSKFFKITKTLGTLSWLSGQILIWMNYNFSIALALSMYSVFSFFQRKVFKQLNKRSQALQAQFLPTLHSSLTVPFVFFIWFGMFLFKGSIGEYIFLPAILVIILSIIQQIVKDLLEENSSQKQSINKRDPQQKNKVSKAQASKDWKQEEAKDSSIYMSVICVFLFLFTKDSYYLDSSSSVLVLFLFYTGRVLLNYRDIVQFYSDSLLPITQQTYKQEDQNKITLEKFIKHIKENKRSMKFAISIVLNLVFMVMEFVYGVKCNSLSLISDAIHMLFDSLSLILGLYAEFINSFKKNNEFTYGYGRVKVLSGFINGIFLLFVAYYLIIQAFQRLIEPEDVVLQDLFIVSVIGLIVNLINLKYFHDDLHHHEEGGCSHSHHHHAHSDHDHSHHDHSHHDHDHHHHDHHHHNHHHHDHQHNESPDQNNNDNCNNFIQNETKSNEKQLDQNIHGVFLHILADTLGSVGVILSTILIWLFEITIFDPIFSIGIAILIFVSVIPLLQSSFLIFLQTSSKTQQFKIRRDIMQIEGVVSISDLHIWKIKSGENIGSCTVHTSNSISSINSLQIIKQRAEIVFGNLSIQNATISVVVGGF